MSAGAEVREANTRAATLDAVLDGDSYRLLRQNYARDPHIRVCKGAIYMTQRRKVDWLAVFLSRAHMSFNTRRLKYTLKM